MSQWIGIESLGFFTSRYALSLRDLAQERGVDPDKYLIGLGQEQMSVPPPGEDVVTLGANAAQRALHDTDRNSIDTLFFATESGVDQSKAAGMYLHRLLDLPATCRVVELKQACYSATAAVQFALALVAQNPRKKMLVVASDIARYGLDTPGEPTQGAGAVALLISADPRLMVLDPVSGVYASEIMDFWRPNYRDEALVDGRYSTRMYLQALCQSWTVYTQNTGRGFADHDRFCYHLPFTRMAEKAHIRLARECGIDPLPRESLDKHIGDSLFYNRMSGNSYSASLYAGLASLLDRCEEDLAGKRVGLFSYGSGCVAEYFSGIVTPGYRSSLRTTEREFMVQDRTLIDYAQYEAFYKRATPIHSGNAEFPVWNTGAYRWVAVRDHKRIYESVP